MSMVNLGHSGNLYTLYFHSFEALNGAFEVQFFRASFLHLTKDNDTI